MDECEIVEWLEDSKASSFTTRTTESIDNGDNRRKKSSHEIVELASDNKTPLRMRDGDFGKIHVANSYLICLAYCSRIIPIAS